MNPQTLKATQLSSTRSAARPRIPLRASASQPGSFRFLALAFLTISLLLSGIPLQSQDTSKKQDELLAHESGFLGDYYSKLQPDPGNVDWLIYFSNPDVLKKSHSFQPERVKVFLVPEAQQRDIDQADLDKLSDSFTEAMRNELEAGHYDLVREPGPDVMVLRFAITNVEPNGGKTNAAVAGTTVVATHAIAPGVGELVPRIKVGKVSIEGEMVDSSGQVQMAFMTSKSGRRFFSGLKAYQKWGDINAAFHSWAKNFRHRLDKAQRNS